MGRQTRFEGIVRGMVDVLDCPLTVKMRAGIYKKNWNAHKLIPKLRNCGVSLVTVSGSVCNLVECVGNIVNPLPFHSKWLFKSPLSVLSFVSLPPYSIVWS